MQNISNGVKTTCKLDCVTLKFRSCIPHQGSQFTLSMSTALQTLDQDKGWEWDRTRDIWDYTGCGFGSVANWGRRTKSRALTKNLAQDWSCSCLLLSWQCTDIKYNLSKIVMLEFSLKLKGSVCFYCKVLQLWGAWTTNIQVFTNRDPKKLLRACDWPPESSVNWNEYFDRKTQSSLQLIRSAAEPNSSEWSIIRRREVSM